MRGEMARPKDANTQYILPEKKELLLASGPAAQVSIARGAHVGGEMFRAQCSSGFGGEGAAHFTITHLQWKTASVNRTLSGLLT